MALIRGFCESSTGQALGARPLDIAYERLPAPHEQPSALRTNCGAVYVFRIPDVASVPEAGRTLKVGMAGPNTQNRFTYQHYKPGSALSTLAASILADESGWESLGIPHVTASNVGTWMKRVLERHHFFVAADRRSLLEPLESYLQLLLKPRYEARR